MSVLHSAAVNAGAATPVPTPSLSPSVSPSASPVVHAAVAHAAAASPSILSSLNSLLASIPQSDLIAVAGALAVALQSLINRLPWLQHDIAWVQDVRRQFVALVLPVIGTLVAGFASGQNTLHLAPVVYVVGQVVYYLVKALQGAASNLQASNLNKTEPANPEGVG